MNNLSIERLIEACEQVHARLCAAQTEQQHDTLIETRSQARRALLEAIRDDKMKAMKRMVSRIKAANPHWSGLSDSDIEVMIDVISKLKIADPDLSQ